LPKQEFEQRAQPLLDALRQANRDGDMNAADANLGALEALAVSTDPPIERLTRALTPWVGFVILPLFAFANAGVVLAPSALSDAFKSTVFIGVLIGLVIGKPLGIVAATWVATRLRVAELSALKWSELTGAGILAGIGFTVAIFIGELAFPTNDHYVTSAKIAILAASCLAGVAGYGLLRAGTSSVARRKNKAIVR
jgi:NhaA family Na+:H+ antiporter